MERSKPIRVKAIAVIALALIVGSAGAQQSGSGMQSYDVEVVIFRTLSANNTPEQWNAEQGLTSQQLVVSDEDTPSAPSTPAPPSTANAPITTSTETFPALPTAKFKLTAIDDTLRRSRNYQSLGHFGWIQPGFPRTEAHYMSIDPHVTGGLTGRVALSRGRYLHLTLDLVLEAPDGSGERYLLQHTRRMRSNERHYIDHPKFGVIALITPSTN